MALPSRPRTPGATGALVSAAPIGLVALLLLVPAIANGFPLVFPDSGTYLGIALGHDYAIDRSSAYGLLLKPFATALQGMAGLWLAVGAQALLVAAILWAAAHALLPGSPRAALIAVAALVPLSSLAWHAGQFMPDAFTGPLILIACLAASRPATAPGAPLLWLAGLILALTHYTHVVLFAATACAALGAQLALGLPWRSAGMRLIAAALVTAATVALLATANGAVLGRRAMSPLGPVFLFARLHEDGPATRWLDRHCGRDAPAALCAARATLPRDSQTLLWGGAASPLTRHIWHPASEAERWRWIDMLAAANRGAIAEQPLAVLRTAASGALRQFAAFGAIDDECPEGCGRNRAGGLALILARDRPAALPVLDASMQLRGSTPKAVVRAVTTPIAAIALALLPFAALLAWRRRDTLALAFAAGIGTALLANATLAGALSDVHDRYQSRVVWLAPFLILFLALRRRGSACPVSPAVA